MTTFSKENERFMRAALEEAEAAGAAGEFPVGCVLVADGRVLAAGRRSGTEGDRPNEVDHAEMVALRQLARMDQRVDAGRITIFSTLEPCLMCYAAILLSGIRRIVYAFEDVMGGGTGTELQRLAPLYRDLKIEILPNVLRSESIRLLQSFFSNPANRYWENSLLARHTLSQLLATDRAADILRKSHNNSS
jgi:tRNA(adenine34) deaminase